MLQQLIDNYEDFHDALIIEVRYNSNYNYSNRQQDRPDEVEIFISCFNASRDYERDLIKIVCRNIIHFNFRKYGGMIFQAFLKNDGGTYVLDFYPALIGNPNGKGLISEENLSSECIIKCKEVEYSIIE